MYLDQMGKQHVSRRRKPSPVRKSMHSRRSPSSCDDSSFSQDVWPRPHRKGVMAHFGQFVRSIFVTDTQKRPYNGETRRGPGFSISMSWVKKLAIAAGIMVIGVVGTSWDSIAEKIMLPDMPAAISMQSLEDPPQEARVERPLVQVMPVEEATDISYEDFSLDLTEPFTKTSYTIQQGDSISKIAERYSLSLGSIIALNKLERAWDIRIGSTLWIPNMEGIPYIVQRNDSISKIAAKMKVPQNAILDANEIYNSTILPGQELFIPGARMSAGDLSSALRPQSVQKPMIRPVAGRITSGFGWREDPVNPRAGDMRFHRAVDMAGKMGDPVKAAMRGTVLHIANNPNLGNFVILKHGEYQTLYAHLSAFSVKTGETVEQGQEIGKIGDTGYTTGPHLHFEVFHNGNRINPLDLVR
jgi:murein DD-endopeptidase MepM/ murein hydrolase activator NlpD